MDPEGEGEEGPKGGEEEVPEVDLEVTAEEDGGYRRSSKLLPPHIRDSFGNHLLRISCPLLVVLGTLRFDPGHPDSL